VLLAADYSQIELRIMAHLSADEGLLKAFADGQDVHQATAAEVFETSLDDVTADQRRSAKAINFGLMYGMSAFGLAKQLDISRGEAQEYVNLYFDRYPGIKTFMDDIRDTAREQGYVETVFGRRLYLPEINARMIMQVHDELVFEVGADEIDAIRDKVVRLMSNSAVLAAPLVVDAGVGRNWDEAH
jgi:DNA polymerase-1